VVVTLLDRIRETFRLAEAQGLSFEKAFNLLDDDGSGNISLPELHATLLKLPNFKNVSLAEVRDLFEIIDTDHSGDVSIAEFRAFVRGEKPPPKNRSRGEEKDNGDARGGAAATTSKYIEPMDDSKAKELLVRHIRRISQIDGSVSGLLAYLDDDEDGLILLSTFKALLRREDVFLSITEQQVQSLIDPLMQDAKHIRTAALLRYIEGNRVAERSREEGKEESKDEDSALAVAKPYDFSPDPEIRALEKKVRAFGHLLSKKGVDVESMFRGFDPKVTGVVRRTELLEVLSKLGMYILEEGKIMDQAALGEGDVQRMQMHQVNRLKGKGGDFMHNAPRMARRLLMNGGNTAPDGDFKVHISNSFSTLFRAIVLFYLSVLCFVLQDHLESMTLVNWYRQGQKQTLLQRILSHSLSHTIRVYPRYCSIHPL
jgi:Ca2+-binding EF-hand superfamily protein